MSRTGPPAGLDRIHTEYQFLSPCKMILGTDHTIEVQVLAMPWHEWSADPRRGEYGWCACRVDDHVVATRLRMVGRPLL